MVNIYFFLTTYKHLIVTINIVFYDSNDPNFTSNECNIDSPKINYNLGWFLGFRNIVNNVLQYEIPIYDPDNEDGTSVTSEAVCDINGPKYFLLLVRARFLKFYPYTVSAMLGVQIEIER